MAYTREEMDKDLTIIYDKAKAEIIDTFKSLMNDECRLEVAEIEVECCLDTWSVQAYNDGMDDYFYSPITAIRLDDNDEVIIETDDDDYEMNLINASHNDLYNILACLEEISNADY